MTALRYTLSSPCKSLQDSHSTQPFSLSPLTSLASWLSSSRPYSSPTYIFHFFLKHSFYLSLTNPLPNHLSYNLPQSSVPLTCSYSKSKRLQRPYSVLLLCKKYSITLIFSTSPFEIHTYIFIVANV